MQPTEFIQSTLDHVTQTSKIQPVYIPWDIVADFFFNQLGEYSDRGILVPRLTKSALLTKERVHLG